MNPFISMNVFRRVVELGSFSAAAARLRISNAAASKHVQALENRLGAQLLTRTTRRMRLTDAGRSFFERCARILDDLAEAEGDASQLNSAPRGLLRVRAPVSLGAAHIGRAIAAFLARYPDIVIELTLNDRFTDPVEEGFDIALRIAADLAGSDPAARPIAPVERVVCAAKRYLRMRGCPATPDELQRHNCIVYTRGESPDSWRFSGPGGQCRIAARGNYRCNNSIILREALLDGVGIALLPTFVVAGDIASGRLQVLLKDYYAEPRTLYAILPQGHEPSPKARVFLEFLSESFVTGNRWELRRVVPGTVRRKNSRRSARSN
jgi:DNA-binding transcriptional LysR family regulator